MGYSWLALAGAERVAALPMATAQWAGRKPAEVEKEAVGLKGGRFPRLAQAERGRPHNG